MKKNHFIKRMLNPYENKWVALSPDHKNVLSSGQTLHDAREQLNKKNKKDAIFFKVLPGGVNYAPFLHEIQV